MEEAVTEMNWFLDNQSVDDVVLASKSFTLGDTFTLFNVPIKAPATSIGNKVIYPAKFVAARSLLCESIHDQRSLDKTDKDVQ